MLSACGVYLSIRYPREKCAKCVFGRLPNCKCPGCNRGVHYLPGTQINPGGSSRPLRRVIEGEFKRNVA